MAMIPLWLVIALQAIAVGANAGMVFGPKVVEKAKTECAKKANGKEWRVVSSIDKKKGLAFLECHVKASVKQK